MRAVWAALLIAALGFSEARAQAGSANFEGWSAVCDDAGECSAWASAGGWATPSYVLLKRGADGRWSAHFGVTGSKAETAGTIAVWVTGTNGAAWTRRFPARSDDQAMRRADLDTAGDLPSLRAAMRSGRTLEVAAPDPARTGVLLPLAGAASALAWIDGRGADPHRPEIRRAPMADQGHLPRAARSANSLCEDPFLTRLSAGKILTQTSCRAFADKSESFASLGLVDETGRALPDPELEDYSEDDSYGLSGAIYDPRTRTLSASQSGEYRLGSCGAHTEWIWDGTRFRMARQTQMVDCVGIPRSLWPSTRRARVIDAR